MYDFDKIKEVSLEILDAVHEFCLLNNLKYSLHAGSLLGAIRHNGFIPWDDDIDIAMPREDFDFFMSHFKSEKFIAISCENDDLFYLPWGKVYDRNSVKTEFITSKSNSRFGVDIDIFPCDYLEEEWQAEYLMKKIKKLNRIREIAVMPKRKGYFFHNVCAIPFRNKENKVSRKIVKIGQKFNAKKHNYIFISCPISPTNELYPISFFKELKLHKFENREFFISLAFDEILKARYGDYMKLPPKEEQIPHHNFTIVEK